MTRPYQPSVRRNVSLSTPEVIRSAATESKRKESEATLHQKPEEVATPIDRAIQRNKSREHAKLAPLIEQFSRRLNIIIANYASDNRWTEEAIVRSRSVRDFLVSVGVTEPLPQDEDFAYVDMVVWQQYCHLLWDLVDKKTPIPKRYLNGMRHERFDQLMRQIWEARRDARSWHSPLRRGNADQKLGVLMTEDGNPNLVSRLKARQQTRINS